MVRIPLGFLSSRRHQWAPLDPRAAEPGPEARLEKLERERYSYKSLWHNYNTEKLCHCQLTSSTDRAVAGLIAQVGSCGETNDSK